MTGRFRDLLGKYAQVASLLGKADDIVQCQREVSVSEVRLKVCFSLLCAFDG